MSIHHHFIDTSKATLPILRTIAAQPQEGKTNAGVQLNANEAYALRAATVAACERAVQIAHEVAAENVDREWLATITEADIDGYLWAKAKDGPLRSVPRLAEQGTLFY